jgi:hypothetical protein
MLPQRNEILTIPTAITIQWGNGNTMARTSESGPFAPYVGFHSEIGKDPAFDAWAHAAGAGRISIRHQRPSAPAEIKAHWDFGRELLVFPLTSGPVAATVSACMRRLPEMADAGLALRWPRGERSRLAVRGYLLRDSRVFLERPVQLSVRSRLTDRLLDALAAHTRVCEMLDGIIDRHRHPAKVACYELALPVGAGAEEDWGATETATVTPFVCQHPAPEAVSRDTPRGRWRPADLVDAVSRDWPGTQAWAREICFGDEAEGEESAP